MVGVDLLDCGWRCWLAFELLRVPDGAMSRATQEQKQTHVAQVSSRLWPWFADTLSACTRASNHQLCRLANRPSSLFANNHSALCGACSRTFSVRPGAKTDFRLPLTLAFSKFWDEFEEIRNSRVLRKEKAMEAPYTIAPLPRALDAANGQVQAAATYSIRGSKKRKRHELVVGIDGEGVSIYNVRSQNLVNSYAIPPQSYICCPPCSVSYKRPKTAGILRRTYLVLRDGPQDIKRRLLCLSENAPRTLTIRSSVYEKQERKLQDGELLSVEALPLDNIQESSIPLHIFVTYRDGRICCIAGDLSAVLWEHKIIRDNRQNKESTELEYAAITEVEAARKGFLTGRDDVLAALQSPDGILQNSKHLIMCQIVREGVRRHLRLYSMRGVDRGQAKGQQPSMQLLMNQELLQSSGRQRSCRGSYDFHVASGQLYELLDGKLTVYDFKRTLPRAIHTLGSKDEPVTNFTRLNSTSALVFCSQKAFVHELKYGSVQGSVSLLSTQTTTSSGAQRTLDVERGISEHWQSVSFLVDLGLVVGLQNGDLKGIQLSEELRDIFHSQTGRISLIDVVNRGITVEKTKGEGRAKKVEDWKAQVDALLEHGKDNELESLVAATLKLHQSLDSQETGAESPLTFDMEMELDGDGSDRADNPFDMLNVDKRGISYILSKVFETLPEDETLVSNIPRLVAKTTSRQIYMWLAQAGLLTSATIQRAMRAHCSGQATVVPGDIMAALIGVGNGFDLVHDLLALPVHWDVAEVMEVLRLLVQSFETPAEGSTLKPLPTPPYQNGDVVMINGDAEAHIMDESAAAERELDIAVSALSSGLEVRSAALRLVVRRLQAFPHSAVTKAMRNSLRHEDIIFLLKILRIELVDGGWTQRYLDIGEDELAADGIVPGATADGEASVPSDSALGSISVLMNCAIDAVGVSGWLVGENDDRLGAAELIDGLKVEISAGVEGLYNADDLSTLLDEMEKYDYSVQRLRSAKSSQVKSEEGRRKRRRDNERAMADLEEAELRDHMLPVDCRADIRMETRKGGKSAHMLAQEKRAKVGVYSFDRIRV